MNKQLLNMVLTSYYETIKPYVKNKQLINIIIQNERIIIKGFNTINTFNSIESFLNYFKSEVLTSLSSEDYFMFLSNLGGL